MAQTKAEKTIQQFNNEITVLALKEINKTELAQTLAKELQLIIKRDIKHTLTKNINVGRLITHQLNDETSKTGRNFQGLIAEITQDMLESIRKVNPEEKKAI